MAKAIALVAALCFLAFATFAHAHKKNVFTVKGEVICDPCGFEFWNRLCENVAGATVKLECTNIYTNNVTYSVEAVTNEHGQYELEVISDHAKDVCEVFPESSPRPDCDKKMTLVDRSRIECTEDSGMHNDVRLANPVGFVPKIRELTPECQKVYAEITQSYLDAAEKIKKEHN